ncbi:MAG: RloB family protein [Thiotrichaceae bacterium]
MAELIIKLFNDPRVNKNNAQLIFSTHNINLMTPELLRRDQIWFTEKQQRATKFYSLDDFDKKKVKPQSPFNQWYAESRFERFLTLIIIVSLNYSILQRMNMPKNVVVHPRDVKPVFHIFCEGETEENYLERYIDRFYSGNRRLKVIKIEETDTNTAKELVEEAIEFQKNCLAQKSCLEGDIFWVVYDRESEQKYSDKLHKMAYDKAKPKKISIAISNVCFEVWILLHFQATVQPYNNYDKLRTHSQLRVEYKKRCGSDYEKGSKQLFEIFTKAEIDEARIRAKRMNQNTQKDADSKWTMPYQWNPYTNVYELLDAIDEFATQSKL